MSKKLKYLSLFSGAGGLDFGVEAAGFSNIGCVEFDKDACEVLRLNTSWQVYEQDIREINLKSFFENCGLEKGELDLIVGGPPCQSFSKSSFWSENSLRGYQDERGKMIDHYMKFIQLFLPKTFLIENVPGFIYESQSDGFKKFKKIIDHISKKHGVNYQFSFQVLNTVDFGVPQKRERVFIVGNRMNREFEFPSPTHFDPNSNECKVQGKPSYRNVADAISNIIHTKEELEECVVGGKWADLLPCIPPGKNYQYFTDREDGVSLFKYRSRYWTFLLKLHPMKPCWTIQASPGSSTGPFHWSNRKLSSKEMASIQTFPEKIRFHTSRRISQKLIGNAVPSAMGEIIAKEIKHQILGMRSVKGVRLVPTKTDDVYRPRFSRNVPPQYTL